MTVPEPKQYKNGVWYIQLKFGSDKNRKSVIIKSTSRKGCIKEAAAYKANYQIGKIDIPQKERTLEMLLTGFIEAMEPVLSPSTIRAYICMKNNRFEKYRSKSISDINWQQLINDEVASGSSPKYVRNCWRLITAAMKHYKFSAPAVSLPARIRTEHEFLLPEEIPKFIEALHGRSCEIAALLALHSMRVSEIIALDWKDVDLNRKVIRVNGAVVRDKDSKLVYKEANKTEASARYIPIMIEELYEALVAVPVKKGKIVDMVPSTLYSQINSVCKRAGLPLVGVHGLRHTFASLAYHLRMPERIAMKIGGWSDIGTMSKIYTHLADRDVSSWGNIMTDFYSANRNGLKTDIENNSEDSQNLKKST